MIRLLKFVALLAILLVCWTLSPGKAISQVTLVHELIHPNSGGRIAGLVAGHGSTVAATEHGADTVFIYNLANSSTPLTITNPGDAGTFEFATALDVFNDSVVVGSEFSTTSGPNATQLGRTFVFGKDSGQLMHTLISPLSSTGRTGFGDSVAAANDRLLVGAWRENNEDGNAYVFDLTNGALLHTLVQPDNDGDRFGFEVAIVDGDFLVSAPTGNQPTAYLFDGGTGNFIRSFIGPAGTLTFGSSAGGDSGNILLSDENSIGQLGRAHLFDAADGTLSFTINNPLPLTTTLFANDLDILANLALIGGRNDDTLASNAGAVFLHNASTGDLIDTVFSPEAVTDARFGEDVDFLTPTVFAVATGPSGTNAYVYEFIPEPSSLLILISGAIGLSIGRRKRIH